MYLSHKIELRPTKEQEEFLKKSCGVKRFVWNACLNEWNKAYKLGFKPDEDYIRFYLKVLRDKHPWIGEVSSKVYYSCIADLKGAFVKMFKKQAKYPRFKKKGQRDSFTISQKEVFNVNGRRLKLPRLNKTILMRECTRFKGEVRSCTVASIGGKWFVSVLVKLSSNPFLNKFPGENQVGIDLGIKEMAVLSNGEVFKANQPLKNELKRLAKLQRSLAKKEKGSNRWESNKKKISKLYRRVSNKRSAVINEFTDYVTKTFNRIVIEDLNIAGMIKNHNLSRALSDVSLSEIRRQFYYKSVARHGELVIANRFFPSSKICSKCGSIDKDLTLNDRVYKCSCGLVMDRDLNAAINLLNYSPGQIQAGL